MVSKRVKYGIATAVGLGAASFVTRDLISIEQIGDFSKTFDFLNKALARAYLGDLDQVGTRGVMALQNATPVDTGETANSWRYEVKKGKDQAEVSFYNDAMAGTVPIAIILQYGHGTNNGGYVRGRDYINPALRPIFDALANGAWVALTK